jgi:mannonate dehydratase
MGSSLSRRTLLRALGAGALAATAPRGAARAAQAAQPQFAGMPPEGPATPKICLGAGASTDEAGMRRLKQVGVDYVLMGGPRIPWDEAEIRARLDRFKAGGLTICNMMISGFDEVIWGRPAISRSHTG